LPAGDQVAPPYRNKSGRGGREPSAIAPLTPSTRRRTGKSSFAPRKARVLRLWKLERQESGASSGAVFMHIFR
jgi:hypothetical protein